MAIIRRTAPFKKSNDPFCEKPKVKFELREELVVFASGITFNLNTQDKITREIEAEMLNDGEHEDDLSEWEMDLEEVAAVWKWLDHQSYPYNNVVEESYDDMLDIPVISQEEKSSSNNKTTSDITPANTCKVKKRRKKPKIVYGDSRYKRKARLRRKMLEQTKIKFEERKDSMSPCQINVKHESNRKTRKLLASKSALGVVTISN